MEMQLVTKKLSEIRPYERNPRRNDPAVASVVESIQQCTYVAPIVVDEDGVILAGHTRYRALKKLKRKEAEVIVKTMRSCTRLRAASTAAPARAGSPMGWTRRTCWWKC